MYDFCGKTFDGLLKRYVLWKYDVYGIGNTLNLCKEYAEIMERDSILVHGFIRQFVETEECALYVPTQLIDLIANRFYHEAEYDIDDGKLHKFACSLSTLDGGQGVHGVDAQRFLSDHDMKRRVKRLFEHEKFQKLWKRRMRDEMQQRQRMEQRRSECTHSLNAGGGSTSAINGGAGGVGGGGVTTPFGSGGASSWTDSGYSSSTINNRFNCYFFGSKSIAFYCDYCSKGMEAKRMCRFKKCGHCLCTDCRRRLRAKRRCGVCQERWTSNRRNFYYLIPKIS